MIGLKIWWLLGMIIICVRKGENLKIIMMSVFVEYIELFC